MIEARLRLDRDAFSLAVDLQLPPRGVTALYGPSGCGKTTLLRALAGLDRATGRVVMDGDVWQDDGQGVYLPPHQRALGYVIQEAALFPHLSVDGNLRYGQRRSGPAAARVDLPAVVDLLGIEALLPRRPATLSGGERQRVAIARALATGPRLLLMDEPLAALDPPRKAEILPYLERLHEQLAMPIVYVTHAMDEVARLADHLVLLRQGRVLAAGPLAELLARPDLPAEDDAGAVLSATVLAHDEPYALSRIGFDGGALWLGRVAAGVGQTVRVRVPARDVSLVRQPPGETSILNVLQVQVAALHPSGASTMVGLVCGDAATGSRLLARITRKSCDALALQVGDRLFAQVKGVSLM
jgi:molybdate transport system ATP-binding protein